MPRKETLIMTDWSFALGGGDFRPVTLPHDWQISAPIDRKLEHGGSQGFRARYGVGYYKKTLNLPEKAAGHRYYIDFGGVYECCEVKVNDIDVGGQRYGYSPFRLDVTDAIKAGENEIFVKVDNTQKPADRWYSGCGIYRTVKLIQAEERHFDEGEIQVSYELSQDTAVITVKSGVSGSFSAEIDGVVGRGEGEVALTLKDVKRWSAAQPYLYTLNLQLLEGARVCDAISTRIGFRTVEFIANKGMFVNGELTKMQGVCLHQDVGCRGTASKKEVWRERLLALKDMGCNAIRPSHHVFSSEFLDLCDEMGFYVYEECFDKWTVGLYGRYFKQDWRKDVAAMVKRDRNRPSIVIWGVGNEVEHQGQQYMLDILKDLRDCILTMDTTRPVSYAMNPHFKRESDVDLSTIKDVQKFVDEVSRTEIDDPHERVERIAGIAGIVDIIACNYQEQWYELIHERVPDKLILGTEVYQFFKGHMYQMQNYCDDNPNLAPYQHDYVIGSMIWTGIDYLGESMGYPAKGWSGAMIRTNGVKKPMYHLLKSFWTDEPMVHFAVMDYSMRDDGVKEHWDAPIYADHWHFPQITKAVVPYMIATNCDEAYALLNGKHYHLSKPVDKRITGFLPYQPGELVIVGLKDGVEACRQVLKTPGQAFSLRFESEVAPAPAEEGYEIMLTVSAVDRDGIPYLRESSRVSFRVEGEGEIIAVDNGDIMGNEPYQDSLIHMYHGCASVMIRLVGKPGTVTVHADSPGLYGGTAKIIVG